MTKQQEIEILEKAIAQLGPDSYLGPWLSDIKAEVQTSIRSDFFPGVSFRAAEDQYVQRIEQAKLDAGKIIAIAKHKADKIEKIAEAIREALRSAERALNW
jgi:hypothetical protein